MKMLGFAGEDAWIKFPKHILPLMVDYIMVIGSMGRTVYLPTNLRQISISHVGTRWAPSPVTNGVMGPL